MTGLSVLSDRQVWGTGRVHESLTNAPASDEWRISNEADGHLLYFSLFADNASITKPRHIWFKCYMNVH